MLANTLPPELTNPTPGSHWPPENVIKISVTRRAPWLCFGAATSSVIDFAPHFPQTQISLGILSMSFPLSVCPFLDSLSSVLVSVSFSFKCVFCLHAWLCTLYVPGALEESIGSLRTGVTEGCEQ